MISITKLPKYSRIEPQKGLNTPNPNIMINDKNHAYHLKNWLHFEGQKPIMIYEAERILQREPHKSLNRINHYVHEDVLNSFDYEFFFLSLFVEFVEHQEFDKTPDAFNELGFPRNIRECRKRLKDVVTASVESIASALWFSMTPEQRLVRVLLDFPAYKGFDIGILDSDFQDKLTRYALDGTTLYSLPNPDARISGSGRINAMSEYDHIASVNPVYGDYTNYLGTISELKAMGCEVPRLSILIVNQASPQQLAEVNSLDSSIRKIFV